MAWISSIDPPYPVATAPGSDRCIRHFEFSWQRLTLIVFHIGDGVIQIRLSPQIFPAATISPRTLVSRPAATLPHFSSGVCFKSGTYVFGFTWGRYHRMDVI